MELDPKHRFDKQREVSITIVKSHATNINPTQVWGEIAMFYYDILNTFQHFDLLISIRFLKFYLKESDY